MSIKEENLKNPVSKNNLQVLKAILKGFQVESRQIKAKIKAADKANVKKRAWLQSRKDQLRKSAMHYQIVYGFLTGLSLHQIVPGTQLMGAISPDMLLSIIKSLSFYGCWTYELKDINDWLGGQKLFLTRKENAARLKELQKALEPSRRWFT